MLQLDNDAQYMKIKDLLKQMPKVEAPSNFEADLMRRINSGNFQERYKVRWWDKLLLPSRLIPAGALALSIVAVFYYLNFNAMERDNPFLTKPKIRESVSQTPNSQIFHSKSSEYSEASINISFKINKEGLNFLQIRLNDAEKAKITRLKEQIRAYFKNKQ